ncbi:Short-chain dehydrogenase [Mesorhizobium sp. NFR06]|uniref:SDR family oxidoreductase n=1 Tax=Mesorhizobium sp. NFR06 TaxID=1566290 RepID=UPI0008E3FC7D|nr:SDR family oxidoreductase [Mesorhizobium sp. NFR06]SFO67286.1 Short-chain dehydrogenase [Mesorhizobium sp. NFR06]
MVAVRNAVVLVTGGQRGLGAALVEEVLRRGAKKVYVTAREPKPDSRGSVVTQALEVRSSQAISDLAQIATDVNIVINNAGALVPESLLTGNFDGVAEMFDVNVYGPLRIAKAFAPILAANGGGAIVNMHSVLSWLSGGGAYGASKAAMWSLSNSLRDELASQHTQVLGVHAAFLDTDMTAGLKVPKTSPAVAAARIVDALEAGAAEVLVDDASVAAKAALSGPVENLSVRLPV